MLRENSPETSLTRTKLIEQIARGSHGGNQLLPTCAGFVVNQAFKNNQNQKEIFQTIHTSSLAEPKYYTNKYVCELRAFEDHSKSPDSARYSNGDIRQFSPLGPNRNMFNQSLTKEMLKTNTGFKEKGSKSKFNQANLEKSLAA